MMKLDAKITDATLLGDGLAVAIEGPGVKTRLGKRNSCVAVVMDVDYEWPVEDEALLADFVISSDRRAVHWPALEHRITIDEFLDVSTAIYFIKWRADRIRPVTRAELVSCWATPAGNVSLQDAGAALIRTVGRGTVFDDQGHWEWRDEGLFHLFRKLETNDSAGYTIHQVVRYDGKTMQMVVTRVPSAVPDGLAMPVLWTKCKPPRSWQGIQ